MTDEEILGKDNVSVADAARYLGWGETSIRSCLMEGRAPFGVAFHAKGPDGGKWVFRISPGGLVEYKRKGCVAVPWQTVVQYLKAARGDL